MITAKFLADLEREHEELRRLHSEIVIRLLGVEAQLTAARRALADPSSTVGLRRTDAIVEVLRGSDTPMTPLQIVQHLNLGGRSDTYRDVNGTLPSLLKSRRISKVDRGHYLAT